MRRSTRTSSIQSLVFGAAQALCLAILLNWSTTSVHALAHYDHGEEEGSGYYYKTQYNENGGCDFKHQIGYKESFPIYNFPPGPHSLPQNYQRLGRIPPQQCVWEFVSRKQDNCTLEFHTHYFQRGDTRCEEEYLLIGDEYGDRKICGVAQPPRRFISSGRKLFLGHFRQNGYKETVASSLNGVVRCVSRPRTNNTNYYNESDGSCQLSMPPTCTFSGPFNLNKTWFGFVALSLFSPLPPQNPRPLGQSVQCQNAAGCDGQFAVCFQTGPVNCNLTGSVLNPMQEGQLGVHCENSTTTCGQGGDCEGEGSGSPMGIDVGPFNCTAPADQLCHFGVAVCTKDK